VPDQPASFRGVERERRDFLRVFEQGKGPRLAGKQRLERGGSGLRRKGGPGGQQRGGDGRVGGQCQGIDSGALDLAGNARAQPAGKQRKRLRPARRIARQQPGRGGAGDVGFGFLGNPAFGGREQAFGGTKLLR